jgi:hypothetical protein
VVAAILGAGYFGSSFAWRNPAVRGLSVVWWLCAAGLLVWRGPAALLALAAMLVAFQVVPGALWYRSARRRAAEGARIVA